MTSRGYIKFHRVALLPGPMPASVDAVVANLLYFEKAQLPQPLANRLIRLAAFQNPEFYRAQAMRFRAVLQTHRKQLKGKC